MNIQQKYRDPSAVLRSATEQDLAEILAMERVPAFHTMVGTWPEQEHRRALHDRDVQYFMIVDGTGSTIGPTAGFAILRGLTSPHRSIELKRFVIGAPGDGTGQRALRAILDHVFRTLRAHRLWLDVFHTLLLLSILDREYLSQPVL